MNSNYNFTIIVAHLKSKRSVANADEAELRLEEAKRLREKVDALLTESPNLNLVVAGDFNDTKDSASTRAIIGRGRHKLIDTRPVEGNGDLDYTTIAGRDQPAITWTHYYDKEDSYRRIDFLLISKGMAAEWVTNQTRIPTMPGWGIASDHRLIVATFRAGDQ